ncbi:MULTISPECIES: DUF3040 domain-containing protein [Pseudonocardia]|uniref:DUF3040 domain-containing protein n=2 Tax=Pseudonocardia TaxID=1847 RepID=A0A1Y2MPM8_PSEAH|nr:MULTISPECIES: DUF3040 domain-containing protein [Pseudonocardia]OSY37183.1 hypothetical protein BG845_04877 [Pseudonocardia autotrophica]TDN74804.1 hypothetical protein C8E95_3934 [Pseudonocardia autotrophica]BBG05579.1 hypothetical protein Pdca_67880 [Pseudonocardia autotrophica]GEC25830.1 hypothetical protein PSA01_28590 [Pseudonocardia saturnea]
MLSERETRRLHEIEVQLRLTDPRLVRRFAALAGTARPAGRRHLLRGPDAPRGPVRSVHGAGPLPSALLGVSLLVLLVGAVMVAVPIVIAGIVLAALSLGVAATVPQRRPGG